jgi:demethylmenaquinone methyltransferase/2-methoxy-6-polyprenyl-1,4-benzoquinol methylase
MFGAIAGRYDLLNRLLSLSIDRYWRRQSVGLIRSMNPGPRDRCLDLCTGTGDLLIDIGRKLGLSAVGADFCYPMLEQARAKLKSAGLAGEIPLSSADALALPFPEGTFRFVTVAFGLRNIEFIEQGLKEMRRVLRSGGVLIILEFSQPVLPVFRSVFALYFKHILPRLGAWVSGAQGPYRYLPDSVGRFPSQLQLVRIIESAGFGNVQYRNLTGGIVAVHWGEKIGLSSTHDTVGKK